MLGERISGLFTQIVIIIVHANYVKSLELILLNLLRRYKIYDYINLGLILNAFYYSKLRIIICKPYK